MLSESGLIDGLGYCVSALRNSQRVDGLSDFFVFVSRAYRAVQEWSAPRVLADGTDAYFAVAERSCSRAKSLFLAPHFVHLL